MLEQRLMTITAQQCEVATFSNVSRVMSTAARPGVSAQVELPQLPPGFVISARISKMRRLRWPVGLASSSTSYVMVPDIGAWETVPKGEAVDLLYLTAGKSCSDVLRRRTRLVVSTDYDCEGGFYGWCILDDRRVVEDLPARLKQYSRPRRWWHRR